MRRIFTTLATLSVVTLAQPGSAAPSARGGLYENVRISSETGDESGVRIRVNDGPSPTVDFTLCEGACLDMERFPVKIDGDRLSFVYVERNTDLAGNPVSETRAKIEGRFVRRGLMVKVDFAGNVADDHDPFVLLRRVSDGR
jgi:hypothetical protein